MPIFLFFGGVCGGLLAAAIVSLLDIPYFSFEGILLGLSLSGLGCILGRCADKTEST